jgi:hypothetical protein
VNLEHLMRMFGSDTAREQFMKLCRAYFGERSRQEAADAAGTAVPATRRSEIHSDIMTVVQKLYLREEQRMPSRQDVGRMIMDYFREETRGE